MFKGTGWDGMSCKWLISHCLATPSTAMCVCQLGSKGSCLPGHLAHVAPCIALVLSALMQNKIRLIIMLQGDAGTQKYKAAGSLGAQLYSKCFLACTLWKPSQGCRNLGFSPVWLMRCELSRLPKRLLLFCCVFLKVVLWILRVMLLPLRGERLMWITPTSDVSKWIFPDSV